MGVVYKAWDPILNQNVSIKLLKNVGNREESAVRFQREARAASQLSHSNLAPVLDFGAMADGTLYMVSKFIQGDTLSTWIKTRGPFCATKAISILRQTADCMAYIHGKGILHRDIKPGNIIVMEDKDEIFAYILDFGIAKLVSNHAHESGVTTKGSVIGSPVYMSPEQGSGREVDFRSDIYSLGCVAYELISGRPPFSGDTIFDTIQQHITSPIPALKPADISEEIPPELTELISSMLSKDADERPESMKAIEEKLLELEETLAPPNTKRLQEENQDPHSFIQGIVSISSKTSRAQKIAMGSLVSLGLFFLLGFMALSSPRWFTQSEKNKNSEKHKISKSGDLEILKDSAILLGDSKASLFQESTTYKDYTALNVLPAKDGTMPDWSELDKRRGKIYLLFSGHNVEPEVIKQVLSHKNVMGINIYKVKSPTSVILKELSSKKDLEILKLAASPNISASDLAFLSSLKSLKRLALDNCSIDSQKALAISKLTSLEDLDIVNDKTVTDKDVMIICSKLKGLGKLDLHGTGITNGALASIAKLKKLLTLDLSSTKTTDSGIDILIQNHSSIHFLNLNDTLVSQAGFLKLHQLKSLKTLQLLKTKNLKETKVEILAKTAKFNVEQGSVTGDIQTFLGF